MITKEEIETLLPWYVTGKLTPSDRAKVEDYIISHPEMSTQVALIQHESEETIESNQRLGGPSHKAFDNLMDEIEREEKDRSLPLLSRVTKFFQEMHPQSFQVAAFAAIALLLGQAVVIGSLMTGPSFGPTSSPAPYETASSSDPTDIAVDLELAFQDDITAVEIKDTLIAIGVTVVGGPNPGGVYQLSFGQSAPVEEELEKIITDLRSRSGLIRFVAAGD